ncbi:MAG: hypothetical protein SFU20_04155 [Chitinophagaceae bacterium]|nr:hypothetical protein [Chitinophagaceae bacterium]
MTKKVQQEFTIHPAGQGLFYSGIVRMVNSYPPPFRFVYDCGSLNAYNLGEEVEVFRQQENLPSNHLNLLVISHFHQDHISHIKKLVEGGVKIDKLVMPFMNFTERLYLCLVAISTRDRGTNRGGGGGGTSDGPDGDLPEDNFDFMLRLIMDPLTTLAENFNDGSEIIFIAGPEESPTGGDNIDENRESSQRELKELTFDFPKESKIEIDNDIQKNYNPPPRGAKQWKVGDNIPGAVGDLTQKIVLMEFIFYRKPIGKDEEKFYEAIRERFLEEFGIENGSDDDIQREVVKLRGGKRIEEIFKAAKKGLDLDGGGRSITNLNTTALCLMHRNTRKMYEWAGAVSHAYYDWESFHCYSIWKPKGIGPRYLNRTKDPNYPYGYFHRREGKVQGEEPFTGANVLLLSDGYFKTQAEVDALYRKFSKHWEKCWLFQLPHHGSHLNSGFELVNRIPPDGNIFVNYGTWHRSAEDWSHPSDELISDICNAHREHDLILVNEFKGLQFVIRIYSLT